MYCYCTIELLPTSQPITISAMDIGQEIQFTPNNILDTDGELPLHKGTYNRIIKDFNIHLPQSFKMITYSDVPMGSGLGSSSSLVVAMIKAYQEWLTLPLDKYQIANLAYEIERQDLGFAGGKQDQFAAAFGGFNFFEFNPLNTVNVNHLNVDSHFIHELENSIVLFYSGLTRNSSDVIQKRIKLMNNNDTTIMNTLHQIKKDAFEMRNIFMTGDFDRFIAYVKISWESKKKISFTQNTEYLNQIYNSAIDAGATCGRILGAGSGGFFLFIIDPKRRPVLLKNLSDININGQIFLPHFENKGAHSWKIDRRC